MIFFFRVCNFINVFRNFFSDFKLQLNYFIDLYFGDLIAQDLFSFLRNYLEMLFILEIFF